MKTRAAAAVQVVKLGLIPLIAISTLLKPRRAAAAVEESADSSDP